MTNANTMNDNLSIHRLHGVMNKVMNKLIKRKYGDHVTIRISSDKFINNRLKNGKKSVVDTIYLKTTKNAIPLMDLVSLQSYLFKKLNVGLLMIQERDYIRVRHIKIIVKTGS